MQGAQKLRSEAHLRVRRSDEVEAERSRWTFYEVIKVEKMKSPEPRTAEPHRTRIRVRYGDTDAMGVVYYANYLRWFEIARTEMMRHLGVAYKALESAGVYLPVSEVFCKYHRPAKYDDFLVVETRIDFLKKVSLQFSYRIRREEDGAELVTGWTLHGFVNREGKIVRAPAPLVEIIGRSGD
jgi:acyl-CoA thioester hydrolase